MKKYLVLLFGLMLLAGCCRVAKEKKDILVKINNYEITRQEFEQEFRESSYGRVDTPESRKDFLNTLINRKLILQDAQKRGLDRDSVFLRMIERFWEQSLLKLALERKTKEIAGASLVSDKVIREAYDKMVKEGKTDKSYDQMSHQIKWEITKLKESQMMNDWVADLHKKAKIEVNQKLLKSK